MAGRTLMTNESIAAGLEKHEVAGAFTVIDDEPWYVIRHVDRMMPFLVSVVSSHDHWLYASSTGGLTAGRVSPAQALFPLLMTCLLPCDL